MQINFDTLKKHFEKLRFEVTMSIAFDGTLYFTQGKATDHGSRVELIDPSDLEEILTLNKIIGDGSQVRAILDKSNRSEYDKEIETLIYGTLAKYMTRLFHTWVSKDPYPEIKWLKKHIHSIPVEWNVEMPQLT
jgi:hypothetical protein